jgi:hypothetical protein
MNCAACGSTNLIEGSILDNSGSENKYFKPKDVSAFKAAFGYGVREITALGCVHCGNLQCIVNFIDEDKRNHQNFDGRQPDLLERIESE